MQITASTVSASSAVIIGIFMGQPALFDSAINLVNQILPVNPLDA